MPIPDFLEPTNLYCSDKKELAITMNNLDNIQYKYEEDRILKDVTNYILSTYKEHYGSGKIEALEMIIDQGHGVGFVIGDIIKYACRYGKKGNTYEQRKDLMKIVYYAIVALYIHDKG